MSAIPRHKTDPNIITIRVTKVEIKIDGIIAVIMTSMISVGEDILDRNIAYDIKNIIKNNPILNHI
jgi:hypothetical protein